MENETQQQRWTEPIERMVSDWRQQLISRASAHEKAASYYGKWNRCINTPELIFSALLGSMGVVNLTNDEPSQAQLWYTSVLSVIIAVLTTLDSSLQFNVKSAQHSSSAKSFSKLATLIQVQLVKESDRREDASSFVDKVLSQMENHKETAPDLPLKISSQFHNLIPHSMEDDEAPHVERRSQLAVNILCV